jgi:Fur family transcriptional regulator, ferric uptake regulator
MSHLKDEKLRAIGLKVTLPRRKVLAFMEAHSEHHFTVDEVYSALKEEGEEVSLATVYRVMGQFEAAGLVLKHNFEGESSVYELATDEHHDHLVCIKCSTVKEFCDDEIERRQERIARKNKFVLTDHSLVIYGICPSCVSRSS